MDRICLCEMDAELPDKTVFPVRQTLQLALDLDCTLETLESLEETQMPGVHPRNYGLIDSDMTQALGFEAKYLMHHFQFYKSVIVLGSSLPSPCALLAPSSAGLSLPHN